MSDGGVNTPLRRSEQPHTRRPSPRRCGNGEEIPLPPRPTKVPRPSPSREETGRSNQNTPSRGGAVVQDLAHSRFDEYGSSHQSRTPREAPIHPDRQECGGRVRFDAEIPHRPETGRIRRRDRSTSAGSARGGSIWDGASSIGSNVRDPNKKIRRLISKLMQAMQDCPPPEEIPDALAEVLRLAATDIGENQKN